MMKVIHKFKTVEQNIGRTVQIIIACEKEFCCNPNTEEYVKTSVDWEDVTCKVCLKRRKK